MLTKGKCKNQEERRRVGVFVDFYDVPSEVKSIKVKRIPTNELEVQILWSD